MQTTAAQPTQAPSPLLRPQPGTTRASAFTLARRISCASALLVSDVIAIALSLQLAMLTRAIVFSHLHGAGRVLPFSFRHYWSFGLSWLWLLFLVFFAAEGLYTERRTVWKEVEHLTKATTLGTLAVLAAVALGKLSTEVSRATLVLTGLHMLLVMPASRYCAKRALKGLWRKPLLIIGATDSVRRTLCALDQDPVLGHWVAGVLDDDPANHGQVIGSSGRTPVYALGPSALAAGLLRRKVARDILISTPGMSEERILQIVEELRPRCESIYVIPRTWGLPMLTLRLDGFLEQQILMFNVCNNLAKPWNRWLKRAFDLIAGTFIAVLALPLELLVALLIKLDSDGPVLFAQERLGQHDRNFSCLKFRSMQVDADEKLPAILKRNPQIKEEWEKYAKLKRFDPRLTRVGGFLRRWSLDEIPQLFNVLKGEMSLVGPRPYMHRERERIGPPLSTILEARPGMTGFWQVNGRNHLTFDDRVQLEAWYVQNWSLWLDCIILAKTARAIWSRGTG